MLCKKLLRMVNVKVYGQRHCLFGCLLASMYSVTVNLFESDDSTVLISRSRKLGVSAPAGEVRLYPASIWACNGFDGELKGLSRGYATTLRGTIKVTDNNRYAAPIAAWLQTEAKTAHLLPGKCMRFKGSANKRHRLWHKNGTEVRVNSFFSSRLAYKPKRSVGNRCLYLGWMRRCQSKTAIKHLSRKYAE